MELLGKLRVHELGTGHKEREEGYEFRRAGHFGEQPAGVARAAEEEVERQEAVGQLSGAGDEALETREAYVEEEAASQGGE
nr:unnamed protein product [Digitaria exilis]